MKITVIGTGYVGLVTGTCFAENGNRVTCVDIDEAKVKRMQKGDIPIYEPHLEGLFQRNIKEKRLTFTTDLASGIKGAEIIFLALPTPPSEDGSADLTHVLGVAGQLGKILKTYVVVVNKSTVPIGTAEKVKKLIAVSASVTFDVVSNPEFLREGFAVDDFMKPDRIVIGTTSKCAQDRLAELYKPFVRQGNPIFFMDEKSAEMTKYAANAFLATKISFMNEIAQVCERVGADVGSVRLGTGADERIGKRFLFPGPGYGGSCFPKDVQALQWIANDNGYDFKILDAVAAVNHQQKKFLASKVIQHYKGNVIGKTLAVWGLAFKADTDDIRESPALTIIEELLEAGAKVRATDPEAIDNVRRHFGECEDLSLHADQYEALEAADALVVATEWEAFRSPDFDAIKRKLKTPTIFDGRNLYDLAQMRKLGFHYESIGRKVIE